MTESMDVAAFVNSGASTSFELEVSVKIDEITPADVTVVSFYDNSLADADSDVASLDMDFLPLGASSRFDVSAYKKLRTALSDFDILHTHYNSVGSIGRLASVGTDTKVVNTEHNDHRHFSSIQNLVNAPTYPEIDAMILNSQSTFDSLHTYERALLYGAECQVVHNGIDFERVEAGQKRRDLPALPSGPKVVTAARIVEFKNLKTLIKAMKPVLAAVPEAELVIIGDGPQLTELRHVAADSGISHSTTFLGFLDEREQVYGTLSECDIFAVPSIYEGFCNAAVEAMSCGLPVVASDIDVLNEVVGEGGRFADPTAPEELASEIISLLTDSDERAELAQRAEKRAYQNFPIEKTAQEYYKIYEKLA